MYYVTVRENMTCPENKCPNVPIRDGSNTKILHLLAYKAVVVLLALVMPICSCSKPRESQVSRFRREAKSAMGAYCTNMVGFSRLNSTLLLDFTKDLKETEDPALWSGLAEVDYINKVGGVERTNINFRFRIETNPFAAGDDKAEVQIDYMELENANSRHPKL